MRWKHIDFHASVMFLYFLFSHCILFDPHISVSEMGCMYFSDSKGRLKIKKYQRGRFQPWELFNKAVMKRVAWSALTLLVAVSLSWWGSPWGSWWCGGSLAPVGGWRVQGTARHRHEPPSPSEWSWQEIKWKNEQHNCQNKSCHEDLKMTLNSCCVTLIRSFHMRWKQDSLAEGEVRLVAGCHATTFSAASFSRVTGRRGGCHGFLETRCHATTTSCSHLIFRAVVFISSLLHPGPLLGRARWITFLLRENKEADWADEEQMYQITNYLEGNNCCKMLFDSKRP